MRGSSLCSFHSDQWQRQTFRQILYVFDDNCRSRLVWKDAPWAYTDGTPDDKQTSSALRRPLLHTFTAIRTPCLLPVGWMKKCQKYIPLAASSSTSVILGPLVNFHSWGSSHGSNGPQNCENCSIRLEEKVFETCLQRKIDRWPGKWHEFYPNFNNFKMDKAFLPTFWDTLLDENSQILVKFS